MENIFNFFAELIAYLQAETEKNYILIDLYESLSPEENLKIRQQAEAIIKKADIDMGTIFFDNKIKGLQSMIECIREEGDFHIGCWILQLLDRRVSFDVIKDGYEDVFDSLNNNIEETGIIILPRVTTAVASRAGRLIKPAGRFYPFLEQILKNVYFVYNDKIKYNGKDFKIKNLIYCPELASKAKENLRIVYSPLLSRPVEEILNITYGARTLEGREYNIFNVNGVNTSLHGFIEMQYMRLLEYACLEKADLVCSCEMLGVKSLYEVDEFGYNPHISHFMQKVEFADVPKLILPPTYSHNGKNSLSVFDQNGKRLFVQDKQNPFKYNHENQTYIEDLSNCENIIWILHIPGWGRLIFPICRDLLVPDYRELLIKELKATLLICPSFSFGNRDFELVLPAGKAFDTRVFWGNACFAEDNHWSGFVGAVQSVSIGTSSGDQRLNCDCKNGCSQNCVFIINIPLDYGSDDPYNDKEVQVEMRRLV